MKLNKLASLALAGLMAVSMLAGCKDNTAGGGQGGEVEVTPSSNYTQTVMDKTNDVTKAIFTGVADSKLDNVVKYTAANCVIKGSNTSITVGVDKDDVHIKPGTGSNKIDGVSVDIDLSLNSSKLGLSLLGTIGNDGKVYSAVVSEADAMMGDAVYMAYCDAEGHKDKYKELIPDKAGTKTVYTLLRISRYFSDDKISTAVAQYLDEIAALVSNDLADSKSMDDYSYTVSVAEADSVVYNDANRVWDSVLIGVVWQVEYAPETY